MNIITDTEYFTTGRHALGDAVGVENRKWYIAIVNNNTEKSVQERLNRLGYETYVAKQLIIRVWNNGKKSKIDKVVLPTLVFIKCTEKERKEIVTLSYINRFMTNKAGISSNGLSKPLAVIPQEQIDTLRYMLGQSDIPISFTDTRFSLHDKVIVIRGGLKGVEGKIIGTNNGKSEVIVEIELLGSAKMTIDTSELKLIK